MRERPKLVYRNVLRGEDRLRMAATIYELRVVRRLPWAAISEATGLSMAKACTIHKQYELEEFAHYLKEL